MKLWLYKVLNGLPVMLGIKEQGFRNLERPNVFPLSQLASWVQGQLMQPKARQQSEPHQDRDT